MDLGFTGSKAVVTGGSKGMGLAIAETLAAEGASVAVMARNRDCSRCRSGKAARAQALLTQSASAWTWPTRPPSPQASPRSRNGGASSTASSTPSVPATDISSRWTMREWDAAFALGTMSGVRSIRAALPLLRAADWARIVTLSAHSIQRQNPRIVAYTASKAALSSVTKNLSKSLAKDGILVNCVCPGTIVTASFTENLKDILAADGLDATDPRDVMTWIDNNFHQPCDLGRAGLPEEIASITAYLASKRNGYVTGATVNVDGGSDFV